MERQKIALLVAQADEDYQSDFIRGVMEKAFSLDYDVSVFSMYIKYQNSKAREIGESNIFNLINYSAFSGVIVLSDMIQTPGVEQKIQEKLHACYSGPVICVDTESEYFHTFWTDGYGAVYDTISHMIEKHGMTDIAYLTGRKNHVHSKRRLEAYRQAMKDHGIQVREDRIFYGDFWYFCGTSVAEELLRKPEDMPQAVVCANDPMAIGVAIGMDRGGMRIPEDIAVVGYGTSEEGWSSPKPITSTYIPGAYYGSYAVEALMQLMEGKKPEEPQPRTKLFIGESCGCSMPELNPADFRRAEWATGNTEGGYQSLHDFLMEDMLLATNVEEFFRTVYDYIYFLTGVKRMDIYIDEHWLVPEQVLKNMFLSEGYPAKMLHVLSYDLLDPERSYVGVNRFLDTEMMMEDVKARTPVGHLVVPLFYEEKSFGYAVMDYGGEARSYNTVARQWFNSVCRGLESLRRTMALEEYNKILVADVEPKFPIPGTQERESDAALTEEERADREEVRRILDENLLTYYFQPIVRAEDGEIYSYEALMRSNSGKKIPPLTIIRYANSLGRIRDIEKATFLNVLKRVDEDPQLFENKRVFINSIPGVKLTREDDELVEEKLKAHSEQIVVELTEQAELEDEQLEGLKTRLRSLGTGIAVDDYGTGYSNVSNLLRYMPDCVKIDRSLLSEIQNSAQKQHFVRNIIEFCHENKILALAEGVETRDELQTVIRLGADLIQGFYVARPSAEVLTSIDSAMKMEICRFHRERMDGISDHVYVAGMTTRVMMNNLIKEDKTTIIIGDKDSTCRDITIAGSPNVSSNIHIEVMEGYDGSVTLENVMLSNQKQRPCIRMAENSKMRLHLVGENRLDGGGILVPESAELTLEGDGNLRLMLNGTDIYGIGNAQDKGHGTIEFYQDGEVTIEANGKNIIGIGSGYGGKTRINKGKFSLYLSGSSGVGIGSLYGMDKLVFAECDMFIDNAFREGICVGNMKASSRIEIRESLFRCTSSGTRAVVLGSISGEYVELIMHDMSIHLNVRADSSAALGSLEGTSMIEIDSSAVRYKGAGREGFVFGGMSPDTMIHLRDVDMKVFMKAERGTVTNAIPERFINERGMSDVEITDDDGNILFSSQ